MKKVALPEIKSIIDSFQEKSVTKIAVVGDNAVGKTSLLEKILNENPSSSNNKTLGFNVLTKKITSGPDENKLLTFLDFSGHKHLSDLRKACYSGIDIIFAICDLTNKKSLENIENFWIPEFMERDYFDRTMKVYFQLVGTKSDLEENIKVSKSDLDKISNKIISKYPELTILGSPIITNAKISHQDPPRSGSVIDPKCLFLP